MMKRNDGFTLVELMVSIAVSTIVTAGVLSILLFGMRINAKTADNVKQQNAVNMLTQIVQTVAEEPNIAIQGNGIVLLKVDAEEKIVIKQVFLEQNGTNILLNGTIFMENVSNFTPKWNGKLLTIEIKTTDGNSYNSSAYYRFPIKEVPPNES